MKVKTNTTKGSRSATGAKPPAKAKPAKAKTTPAKRETAQASVEVMRKKVAVLRKKGTSWSEIATELHCTPGRAQYFNMLNLVEDDPTLALEHGNEKQLTAAIKRARAARDEHSSWGWISARTGVPEGRIKALAEAGGFYTARAENIAAVRAASKAPAKAAAKSNGKATTKAKTKRTAANPSKKG